MVGQGEAADCAMAPFREVVQHLAVLQLEGCVGARHAESAAAIPGAVACNQAVRHRHVSAADVHAAAEIGRVGVVPPPRAAPAVADDAAVADRRGALAEEPAAQPVDQGVALVPRDGQAVAAGQREAVQRRALAMVPDVDGGHRLVRGNAQDRLVRPVRGPQRDAFLVKADGRQVGARRDGDRAEPGHVLQRVRDGVEGTFARTVATGRGGGVHEDLGAGGLDLPGGDDDARAHEEGQGQDGGSKDGEQGQPMPEVAPADGAAELVHRGVALRCQRRRRAADQGQPVLRGVPAEAVVDQHPERVDVGRGRQVLARELLGRGIAGRAEPDDAVLID